MTADIDTIRSYIEDNKYGNHRTDTMCLGCGADEYSGKVAHEDGCDYLLALAALERLEKATALSSGFQKLYDQISDDSDLDAQTRNAALDEAAQVADSLYNVTYWDDPSAGIAATIRKLKEPT